LAEKEAVRLARHIADRYIERDDQKLTCLRGGGRGTEA